MTYNRLVCITHGPVAAAARMRLIGLAILSLTSSGSGALHAHMPLGAVATRAGSAVMGRKQRTPSSTEPEPADGAEFMLMDRGQMKRAKLCLACKRPMTWRKKWERCWDEVMTCSKRCKSERKKARSGGAGEPAP